MVKNVLKLQKTYSISFAFLKFLVDIRKIIKESVKCYSIEIKKSLQRRYTRKTLKRLIWLKKRCI